MVKETLNIFIYSPREKDWDITLWLLRGTRITAPPHQRGAVSYFNGEKWLSWGGWAILFWLWSSSLPRSTGAMNKTWGPVRRGTLALGSTVRLQLEKRGAPHHEKCAESLPFDGKSCRGKIVGDWEQIYIPVSTGRLLQGNTLWGLHQYRS